MGVLLHKESKIVYQGVATQKAQFYIQQMIEGGTNLVGSVLYDEGVISVKKFFSIEQIKEETYIDASIIYAQSEIAVDCILEAVSQEVPLVICTTMDMRINDVIKIKRIVKNSKTKLLGPGSLGIINPGMCSIGLMNPNYFQSGNITILGRTGALIYESAKQLNKFKLGQRLCLSIGGDAIVGMSFLQVLKEIAKDTQTKAVLLLGEIGGDLEEEALEVLQELAKTKKIFAYFPGEEVFEEEKFGLSAGAVISANKGTSKNKIALFELANIKVIDSIFNIGQEIYNFHKKNIL